MKQSRDRQVKVVGSMLLAATLIWSTVGATPAYSQSTVGNTAPYSFTTQQMQVFGSEANSEDVKSLLGVFDDLVRASNNHSLDGIIRHYSPNFISGDNFNLEQIKSLISETWGSYPDIHYESTPLEVRINGDWATIETQDRAVATAPPEEYMIEKMSGKLVSESRSMLFFRRNGNNWEVDSDTTLWEQASIRYGIGEEVNLVLSAPEQVKAGEAYSATVKANIPDGTFTIATIDNEVLEFPHPKLDAKFRALSSDSHDLKRVLTANNKNRNEIVTATIGLTNVQQKMNQERPSLSVNGIATIVKRVNVVPITGDDIISKMKSGSLVRQSANGTVDLSKVDKAQQDEDVDLELVQPESDH